MKYVYTVWLRDESLPTDDPDYEWPACFIIEAVGENSARAWGDRLAESYARRCNQSVLRSAVEALEPSTMPGLNELPIIRDGELAADNKIGW